jgi:hypothetical protein
MELSRIGGIWCVVFTFDLINVSQTKWPIVQKCSACTKSRPKAHGAPIQCTKGKCPKAFHVSCARDGKESGIVFNVLREVEKEVVLLDPGTSAPINPPPESTNPVGHPAGENGMNVHATQLTSGVENSAPAARVLKVIKKVEVQVLCTQHNPVRDFQVYLISILILFDTRPSL